jgi:hypothetical protein
MAPVPDSGGNAYSLICPTADVNCNIKGPSNGRNGIVKVVAIIVALLPPFALALDPNSHAPAAAPEIRIKATQGRDWQITYRLRKPTRKLAFWRPPGRSRSETWKTDRDFEIVATGDNDGIHRRDGGTFDSVSVAVPPVYGAGAGGGYGPFMSFGDGAILFYTGQLFACADVCPEDPRWSMHLTVVGWSHILARGQWTARQATWTESGDGCLVYIGETRPVETADMITVLDAALPSAVRSQLLKQLPEFMHYFTVRLGDLPRKPMVFASYDASYPHGWGREGGAPADCGQIFSHFYGKHWPEEMAKPDFTNAMAWHFAHEAAHLYQRLQVGDRDAWIHEGGAEAFAATALRAGDDAEAAYVVSRVETAEKDCTKRLDDRAIREALDARDVGVGYSCGLVLNLAIDAAVKRASPGTDGLYAIWRDLIARMGGKNTVNEGDFLESVGTVGGSRLAESVRRIIVAKNPNFGSL